MPPAAPVAPVAEKVIIGKEDLAEIELTLKAGTAALREEQEEIEELKKYKDERQLVRPPPFTRPYLAP